MNVRALLEGAVPPEMREDLRFFGVPLRELSREELELGMCHLAIQIEAGHERFREAMKAWRMFERRR